MKISQSAQAVTYILAGTIISLFNSVIDTWTSACLSIFGFIWVYVGYQKLAASTDTKLAEAAKLLKMAAILGIIASVLDIFPIISIMASVVFAIVMIIEIVGLLKMKGATTIDSEGKSGINFLLIGIVFSIISSLMGLLPFIGGTIAAFITIFSITLTFYGWIKIQAGIEG